MLKNDQIIGRKIHCRLGGLKFSFLMFIRKNQCIEDDGSTILSCMIDGFVEGINKRITFDDAKRIFLDAPMVCIHQENDSFPCGRTVQLGWTCCTEHLLEEMK